MSDGMLDISYKQCDCGMYCVVIVSVKDPLTHV
jgi:hypothetical protein